MVIRGFRDGVELPVIADIPALQVIADSAENRATQGFQGKADLAEQVGLVVIVESPVGVEIVEFRALVDGRVNQVIAELRGSAEIAESAVSPG